MAEPYPDNEEIRNAPKIELHLHLEGSLRPATIAELAKRNNMPLPGGVTASGRDFECRSHDDLWRAFGQIRALPHSADDYALITSAMLAELASQNVKYAEFRIAPANAPRQGIRIPDCIEAVYGGMVAAREKFGIHSGLIIGFSRERAETDLRVAAETALKYRHFGIVGFDIFGEENARSEKMNREVAAILEGSGLPLTVHAGEWDGPDSVRQALDTLNPARIGHGTSAAADPQLVETLARRRVHVETCPTSNFCTGSVASIEAHPLRRFFDAGVSVSINTDDPGIFGNTITVEYQLARDIFNFTADDFRKVHRDSIAASFAPDDVKKILYEHEFPTKTILS